MYLEEELYDNIKKITMTDYEGFITDSNDYLVTIETVKGMLEDLLCEVYHYKEQYEDLKQDMYQNYKFVGDEPDNN